MELFVTAGNTMPPRPIVSAVRTRDRLTLRVARWSAPQSRGTVLIAMGRAEFIEHYYEVVGRLLERRFDVVVFDWRGQGQSDREIRNRRSGYVTRFGHYRRDLVAVEAQILRPFAKRPWFALAHSMGAAVVLDQAHAGRSPFERLFLSAPMIGISLRHKMAIARLLRGLDLLGLGRLTVPGGRDRSLFEGPFEGNILTTDAGHFRRLADAIATAPDLAVGAPTIRWTSQALAQMRRFEDPRYAVQTATPILIVAAGADRIVDTAATERFALRLKAGRCITVPGARHQIMMESKAVTDQFWAAFDSFIPGEQKDESDDWSTVSSTKPSRSGVFRRASELLFGST